jgi:hypothetical protein
VLQRLSSRIWIFGGDVDAKDKKFLSFINKKTE